MRSRHPEWRERVGISYGHFRFSNRRDTDGGSIFVRAGTNTLAADPRLQLDILIPAIPGLRLAPLGACGFGDTVRSEASVQVNG